MKHEFIFTLILFTALVTACTDSDTITDKSAMPGFRVRSDFAAALNFDSGWAGNLNENVTVVADQPFRIRFEMEGSSASTGDQQFRLEYRRNKGSWINVESHDFPHPLREIAMDFKDYEAGVEPAGWTVVEGNATEWGIAPVDQQTVLRVSADKSLLVALYNPPWEVTDVEIRFRLAPDNLGGITFLMGYIDADNQCLIRLDPSASSIRLVQKINGAEKTLANATTEIPVEQWLDIEIQSEGEEIEVNFQNDLLELDAPLEAEILLTHPGFQVPANNGVDFQQLTFAGEAKTPRISIVSCPAYKHGMATRDLLHGSANPFRAGTGINLADHTPKWNGTSAHGEFEWPLVIRRFADRAMLNNDGDTFELRMVDATGASVHNQINPLLSLTIPPGHVGGTYIENPGRIGPWKASNGDLYFMIEPSETDNLFMMIKSTDNGRTWQEIDAANRPVTDDLESVDSRLVGDTIHILHQITESARYHAFRTSDHPTHPDTWVIRDELAGTTEAVAQTATMVVRSDGSIVAFYLGPAKIHYSIRSVAGSWSPLKTMDSDIPPDQAGPQAVLGANGIIHLAYYGTDGTIWYRRFLPDGTLTPRDQIDKEAGMSRAEFGAVLPLVYIPQRNEVVIIYRLATGHLYERRILNDGSVTEAVRVTDRKVVTDAVDSQQAGADAVLDGETIHVLFIDESSRSIYHTHDRKGWQPPTLLVDNIRASWVRGNVYTRNDGVRVYGYVYDAGSDGGAGMNRFDEIVLNSKE